jgi:predicted neuraminidase
VRTEHVFGDLRPFAQCHAATLVGRPDGGWLAAWFAGTREGHEDVAIWAATRRPRNASDGGSDGGETSAEPPPPLGPGAAWSAPRPIARVRAEAHWNPVLFALDTGGEALVLHFKVGERIRHWETWHQSSTDGGETWTPATPLVPGDRGGRGAVRAKPIRLASGDWLAGASLERKGRWDVFFDRSPGGLTNWRATPLVERDRRAFGGKGLIQPTLWESRPGHVHALLRSTDGRVHRSDSDDDGNTWSPAYPTALPNNNSGLDVARLADGRLALACNPVPGNWAARTPLSVLFSEDNGATWPARVDVETEPGEFSYPALVARGDRLALAYTWNRRRIAFAEPTPPG